MSTQTQIQTKPKYKKYKATVMIDKELWAKAKYVATLLEMTTNELIEYSLRKTMSKTIDELKKEIEAGETM